MSFSACMIGSSVVPGLPNRCVMPSSFSNARRPSAGDAVFHISSCPRFVDPRHAYIMADLECAKQSRRLHGCPAMLDNRCYLCNQSVTYHVPDRSKDRRVPRHRRPDPAGPARSFARRPANAGTLAADFRSSRPAVSKHLRVLREARLVVDTRIGRERVYAVNPVPLQSVAGWLEGYRAFWQVSLTRLKRNLEEK
jgi:Predicted transcriptional regulators